jgi:hypothetical protein
MSTTFNISNLKGASLYQAVVSPDDSLLFVSVRQTGVQS